MIGFNPGDFCSFYHFPRTDDSESVVQFIPNFILSSLTYGLQSGWMFSLTLPSIDKRESHCVHHRDGHRCSRMSRVVSSGLTAFHNSTLVSSGFAAPLLQAAMMQEPTKRENNDNQAFFHSSFNPLQLL